MAATAKEQRERIEAILATIVVGSIPPETEGGSPTPVLLKVHDGPECPVPDADLPLAIVLARGATRAKTNANRHLATRTFDVIVLVERVCDDTVAEQRRVFDATEALIDVVPDYFAASAHRLELNKVPLTGIFEVGAITDDGPEFRQWGGEVYGAITHRIPVTSFR